MRSAGQRVRARRAPTEYQRARLRPAYLMLVPIVVYLLVFSMYPIVATAVMSVRDVNIGNIVSGLQPWAGSDNFRSVLGDPGFAGAGWVTLWFAVGSLVVQVPVALFYAVLLHARVPGHTAGLAVLVLGWTLPAVTWGAIVRLLVSSDVGVVNTLLLSIGVIAEPVSWLSDPRTVLPTMILAHSWSYIPFTTLLIYGALKGLPRDIYEAAKLDGAGVLQSFRHLTLPLLRPVLAVVAVLVVIVSFRVFDLIFVLTRGGPNERTTTLPFHAYREAFVRNDYGAAAAIAMLTLGLLVVVAVLYVYVTRPRDEAR